LIERHKIEADRLIVESAGESQPIADNKTAAGKKQNRRVEVIMMVEQETK
jgi:OmpA-OmpF porin, OOP family